MVKYKTVYTSIKKRFCYILVIIILFNSPFLIYSQNFDFTDYLADAVSLRNNGKPIGSALYYFSENELYLISAAHVLFKKNDDNHITNTLNYNQIECLSYHPNGNKNLKTVIKINNLNSFNSKKHLTIDICVIKLGYRSNKSKYVKFYKNVKLIEGKAPIAGFNNEQIRKFNEVVEGSDIRILGYPTYLSKAIKDKNFFNFNYPLVQSGIISGKDPENGNIIVSGSVYYGNSGGGVLIKSDLLTFDIKDKPEYLEIKSNYYIIGIVSSFIPFPFRNSLHNNTIKYDISNSGYSVIVPIDYAFEIIDRF